MSRKSRRATPPEKLHATQLRKQRPLAEVEWRVKALMDGFVFGLQNILSREGVEAHDDGKDAPWPMMEVVWPMEVQLALGAMAWRHLRRVSPRLATRMERAVGTAILHHLLVGENLQGLLARIGRIDVSLKSREGPRKKDGQDLWRLVYGYVLFKELLEQVQASVLPERERQRVLQKTLTGYAKAFGFSGALPDPIMLDNPHKTAVELLADFTGYDDETLLKYLRKADAQLPPLA